MTERRNIISERGIEGAPDLVVEILSPGTRETDTEVKRKLYASMGVREYWLVDPVSRSVAVLMLAEDGFETRATYGPGQVVISVLLAVEMSIDSIFSGA